MIWFMNVGKSAVMVGGQYSRKNTNLGLVGGGVLNLFFFSFYFNINCFTTLDLMISTINYDKATFSINKVVATGQYNGP